MGKLFAFFKLFELGKQVADPALWKARQVNVNTISALILGMLNLGALYGHPFPINTDMVNMISGFILSTINGALTIVTSVKIGVVPTTSDSVKTTMVPGIVSANPDTPDTSVDDSSGLVHPSIATAQKAERNLRQLANSAETAPAERYFANQALTGGSVVDSPQEKTWFDETHGG